MNYKEHELDEWYRLQQEVKPYKPSRLRITRCQLTFQGYDGLELILRKSHRKTGGLSLKFAERGGKRKTKWLWLWEHFTNEEMKMIAHFLLSQAKKNQEEVP